MSEKQQDTQQLINKQVTYKLGRVLGNVLTICIGGFYFGYVLIYFTTLDYTISQKLFKATFMSPDIYQGILSAIVPVGAGIGAFSSSFLSNYFSRRNSLLFTCCLSLLGAALVQITQFSTFFIGRIIQGFCVGLYSSFCPVFIKQISPIEISGGLVSLNQLFTVFGIIVTNIIAAVVKNPQDGQQWRIIFAVPILLVGLQALLLIFVYPNETPKYLLLNGKRQQAKELISNLYISACVDEILKEKQIDINIQKKSNSQDQSKHNKSKTFCSIIAIYLQALQQLSGINIIMLFGADILKEKYQDFASFLQLAINCIQFAATILAALLLKKIGRKILLQFGTLISAIMLIIVGYGYTGSTDPQKFLIIVCLFVYIAVFGVSLGPVVWLYVSEIVQGKIISYATLSNWTFASFCIVCFPILSSILGKPPLFYFLGAFCFLSFCLNHFVIVQTKDKTQKQIAEQFGKLFNS